MSGFSDVDAATDPTRLVSSLGDSARGLASMKHYMAAAHAQRGGLVLDVGCGAGHDMAVLDGLGVASVGVDPSEVMVAAARSRTTGPVTRAMGQRLPFLGGAFAGCWIERVLMHVVDPAAVLREVVRCVEPDGLVTVFEPDWSSLTVNGQRVPTAWTTRARHPAIGSQVGGLLEELGCFVRDRVEERSWWAFAEFEAITSRSIAGASRARPAVASDIRAWVAQVQADARRGVFSAEMTKVLWVATTPEP